MELNVAVFASSGMMSRPTRLRLLEECLMMGSPGRRFFVFFAGTVLALVYLPSFENLHRDGDVFWPARSSSRASVYFSQSIILIQVMGNAINFGWSWRRQQFKNGQLDHPNLFVVKATKYHNS
jgi:hypothetical protein